MPVHSKHTLINSILLFHHRKPKMKKVFGDLVLIICLVSFVDPKLSAPEKKLPESEIEALGVIASKLKIPSSIWDFNINPCTGRNNWTYAPPPGQNQTNSIVSKLVCGDCNITTNRCHVVGIVLKSLNLTGVLPKDFSNLTHLKILDLSRNVISGSIPAAWGSLPLLNLTLLGNRISGVIPDEIGNIDTLVYLGVEANLLEGPIPRALGRLSNLSRLLLSSNKFTGEIPDSLSNLKKLTDFRIDGTGISGKIPSFIGNWTTLKRLDLQGTSLEGSFPPTFSALKLDKLLVSDFKGDGTFPPLEEMNLEVLVLRNCSIARSIPNYIGSMERLETLDLSFNDINGEIPGNFKQLMSDIKSMYLNNNMLSGTIPEWMFGHKPIDLSYNNFTGPDKGRCQENEVNLVSSLSSSNSSRRWCLRKNLPCPNEAKNYRLFINCGGKRVEVDGKTYEGDTGDDGQSVFSVFNSPKPKWAYSSNGDFVSNPNAKYIVSNASILDIKEPELYKTARTSASSLRYYGLCLQNGSYNVTLHFAEIILTHDKTFSSVGARIFDVFIQGKKVLEDFNIAEVAEGSDEVLKSFNASVDSTLEVHLRWSGKGTNSIPDRGVYGPLISAISVEPNFKPKLPRKGLPVSATISIVIASCLIFSLAIVLFWKVLHRNRQKNKELKYLRMHGANFTINQIKVATRNFDPINKIGEGGFGPVYKGILPDGRIVAVKQHSPESRQGNREFVNEIGMISSLQHPNLVALFGCCIGEKGRELMLIYEYMENNSLARALFGDEEKRLHLNWQTRRKICLGIARGLSYLHEGSGLKIIHRDVKAANVLLDRDLNAKISDFGLARLDDDDDEHTHISTKICGTVGYMAPEYATRGYLTEKADVYSYGVVILEIVSGRKASSLQTGDFVHLLDWAYDLQEKGRLVEIIDPSMGSDYSKIEVERMLNIAILCTNLSPNLRPTITSVVKMIEEGGPILVVQPDQIGSGQVNLKSDARTSPMKPKLSSSRSWNSSSSTMCGRGCDAMP